MRNLASLALAACGIIPFTSTLHAAPTQIGLVGWFDASDSSTILTAGNVQAADGNGVALWGDKGTVQANQDGLQASAANQPTYHTNVLGHPALTFDGNDVLVTPAMTFGPFTYFTVVRATGNGLFWERSPDTNGGGAGGEGEYLNSGTGGTATVKRSNFSAKDANAGGNWALSSQYVILEHAFDGTDASNLVYKNGDTVPLSTFAANAGANSATPLSNTLGIGGRSSSLAGFSGDMAELLVYDHALVGSERDQVGSYLASKYGITASYVPEPSTLAMLGLGGLLMARRRRI